MTAMAAHRRPRSGRSPGTRDLVRVALRLDRFRTIDLGASSIGLIVLASMSALNTGLRDARGAAGARAR